MAFSFFVNPCFFFWQDVCSFCVAPSFCPRSGQESARKTSFLLLLPEFEFAHVMSACECFFPRTARVRRAEKESHA